MENSYWTLKLKNINNQILSDTLIQNNMITPSKNKCFWTDRTAQIYSLPFIDKTHPTKECKDVCTEHTGPDKPPHLGLFVLHRSMV